MDGNHTISLKFLTSFYQWRLRIVQPRVSSPSEESHPFKIMNKYHHSQVFLRRMAKLNDTTVLLMRKSQTNNDLYM